jgi:5-dehydro-2-deoxygluconokinase
LRYVDIVIGTDDEMNASALREPTQVKLTHSQVSDARVDGDVEAAIRSLLAYGPRAVVQKRGAAGSRVHALEGGACSPIEVPGFPVEVVNVLGAGDAFASGFLYGYLHGWDWYEAARFGNACGAILVTRHGCANFMPTQPEVRSFMGTHLSSGQAHVEQLLATRTNVDGPLDPGARGVK